ncbi:FecR family protein [Filimonas lacunae]|uniref:FecR family protein n=1 Tax=Filimonas lacunae TaxID=477680 RepID=A0A173MQZ3_9BACT|nr:FecR domain-containing protein [Filimonas lacunae]BAV10083.1 anti-sigma factor [Filimonas lacunae]SIS83746.1 FecR family protein [Filimonas lacunae]
MDNLPEDILQALHHYADGQATAEEIKAVDAWISGLDFEEALAPEIESELDKIYNRSHESLMQAVHENNEKRLPGNLRPLLTYSKIAASVIGLIILGAGAFWALNHSKNHQTGTIVAQSGPIVPGGKKATLVLSNGKQIDLSTVSVGGELAKEGNAGIRKTAEGQIAYDISQAVANNKSAGYLGQLINTIIIPNGGEYSLTLSDGTRIWMNAATKLRFPSEFQGTSRTVELLEGEAYFEVAKNASQPFHVITSSSSKEKAMDVEVLGTSFNINTYHTIQATLVSGAVKVAASNNTQAFVLKPGDQANMLAGSNIEVEKDVDIESVIAWKEGYFEYENTPLTKVLDDLARWYNVKIVYKSPVKKETTITGKFNRSNKLEETLENIRFIGVKLEYKVENRTIFIN